MKHKLRREILYRLLRLYGLMMLILPFKTAVELGRWTGWLAYCFLGRLRNKTKENLSLAFGKDITNAWIETTARGVFENLGRSLAEVLSFPKITKDNISALVEAEGLEKVDRVLKQGRGAIIVTCHLDNWELLACYFSLTGYKVSVVARQLYFERYDRLLNYYRTSKGARVLDRDGSPKHILKALKDNQVLGILPDQDVDSLKGIFVDFFGRLAYTPIGPVSLALASGAALVPCFIVRTSKGHKIMVEEPIEVTASTDKDRDIKIYTQRWSGIVEAYIRQYPDQWVWMHPRWKTQPPADSISNKGVK